MEPNPWNCVVSSVDQQNSSESPGLQAIAASSWIVPRRWVSKTALKGPGPATGSCFARRDSITEGSKSVASLTWSALRGVLLIGSSCEQEFRQRSILRLQHTLRIRSTMVKALTLLYLLFSVLLRVDRAMRIERKVHLFYVDLVSYAIL